MLPPFHMPQPAMVTFSGSPHTPPLTTMRTNELQLAGEAHAQVLTVMTASRVMSPRTEMCWPMRAPEVFFHTSFSCGVLRTSSSV